MLKTWHGQLMFHSRCVFYKRPYCTQVVLPELVASEMTHLEICHYRAFVQHLTVLCVRVLCVLAALFHVARTDPVWFMIFKEFQTSYLNINSLWTHFTIFLHVVVVVDPTLFRFLLTCPTCWRFCNVQASQEGGRGVCCTIIYFTCTKLGGVREYRWVEESNVRCLPWSSLFLSLFCWEEEEVVIVLSFLWR